MGEVVAGVGVLWSYYSPCRGGTQVICVEREKSGRYVAVVMIRWRWQVLEAGGAPSLPGTYTW